MHSCYNYIRFNLNVFSKCRRIQHVGFQGDSPPLDGPTLDQKAAVYMVANTAAAPLLIGSDGSRLHQ